MRTKKVTDIKVWQCPKCKANLEKGALGKTIFIGESIEKIRGVGTCQNCGSAFKQSDIYGGKYDYKEKIIGIDKSNIPDKIKLIIFRPGLDQPTNPQKYYKHVLKKAYGSSKINVKEWRIAGTISSLTLIEVKALYSQGKSNGMLPDFGKPIQDWSGKGKDRKQIAALFFKAR